MRNPCPLISLALLALSSCAHAQAPHPPAGSPVTIEDVGRFDFPDTENSGATQLSGLAWSGKGDLYYAVTDKSPSVYKLAIRLDNTPGPLLGQVLSATIDPARITLYSNGLKTPFPGGPDREGCAYDPKTNSIVISDEGGDIRIKPPEIRRHSIETGLTTQGPATPHNQRSLSILRFVRPNLSLESLTRIPDGSGYWTANEEALSCDGDRSTTRQGTTLRLFRLDNDFKCTAQYAYTTEPVPEPSAGSRDHSGVSDLCALPDGSLLVLERAVSFGGYRTRIFLADTSAATDLTKGTTAGGLKNQTFTPAKKTLLFDHTSLLLSVSNYEGITLGPPLPDGSHALLLLADNNGAALHSVYALRVRFKR